VRAPSATDRLQPQPLAPPPSGPARTWARLVQVVDDTGERWSARLRGRGWADACAAVLSNLADHGVVWVAVAAWCARRRGPARRRAVTALVVCGGASFGLNRALKGAAGRSRPSGGPAGPIGRAGRTLPVRSPTSSSFPSGHTLASFCTAVVLPARASGRAAGLAFATAVAVSRVHLRAHHASDVLGGAAVGACLGALVRPLVDALTPE